MQTSEPRQDPSTSNIFGLRSWLYMLAGILIGGFFLYLTMRNIDLKEAMATIYAMSTLWLLPLTIVYLVNLTLRSVRWQFMFSDRDRPPIRYTVDAFMIGKLGNNFLPGRLGELLRASALGRMLPSVGVSGSLATVVLEKVLDALAVLALLGLALLVAPLPDWVTNAGILMVAIFPAALLFLLLVDKADQRISRAGETSSHSGAFEKVMRIARSLLEKFSTGLYTLRNAKHFTALSALTLFIWFLEIIVFYICMQAFSIPAPATAALIALVFLCLGNMLPTAPGFIGTYQLFIVAGLTLYDVPETDAFALAVFLNAYVILLTTVLGLLSLFMTGGLINLKQALATARNSA